MKPLEKEAYAMILEKAWAAIVGGYKNINGGRAYNVLNKILVLHVVVYTIIKWKF